MISLINRPDRWSLFLTGKEIIGRFCELNSLNEPVYVTETELNHYGWVSPTQPDTIFINVTKCRLPMYKPTDRLQSYPGNKSDRTVLGVLMHEFGHYVDLNADLKNIYCLSKKIKAGIFTEERGITSYDNCVRERIAESFRLFMLNPNLLKAGRPKIYGFLSTYYKPVFNHPWEEAFKDSGRPEKYIYYCTKWIGKK